MLPAERRRLIDGFERAAKDLRGAEPKASEAMLGWQAAELPGHRKRPRWMVRVRIDGYAYARGFLATGFSQLARSLLSFLWPRSDPVHARFVRALVHDDPQPAKPSQLSLTRTLLEMKRSADFLVASDYFLKRNTDEHSAFRKHLRRELETWEPFGLALLTRHSMIGEEVFESLRIIKSRYERAGDVDVFDLPVIVRVVCRTVLGVSAHPAEIRDSVFAVANIVEGAYRRFYGSTEAMRQVRQRLDHAGKQFAACRSRLEWFATQCYPLLLKMVGTFAEQRRAFDIRKPILGYLGLEEADFLRPDRKGREGGGKRGKPARPTQPKYRTDIHEYRGVASMLAHAFPGIGLERILEGDYSSFPPFAARYLPLPEAALRRTRRATYEELVSSLSHRDPLAPVIMLHRIVEAMLDSVDLEVMSKLADPTLPDSSGIRGTLEELRRQWTAAREELLVRYVQEVEQYRRESAPPGNPEDAMASVARRRAQEIANQIRNHVVWGYGYIERTLNRQHYFRCRPLYNVADELLVELGKLQANRTELARGNPVLVDRLRSNLFLRFKEGPIPAHIKTYAEAVAKVKPVLADPAAETQRVFFEFLLGSVDLLDHLLNDPQTPLRAAGSQLQVAGEEEERLRDRPRDGPQEVRDGLRRDFGGLDELTGLVSKNEYLRTMPELFRQAGEAQQNLSFLFLDIDRFKIVNDTQGHEFGDRVLKGIADVVRAAMREEDVAARFGGEEFLLAVRVDADDAAQQAERIRRSCEGYLASTFPEQREEIAVIMGTREFRRTRSTVGGASTRLDQFVRKWRSAPIGTVSVGVAQGLGRGVARPCKDDAELLRLADRMLYLAKDSGRNRVVVLSDELQMPLAYEEHQDMRAFVTGNGSTGARGFIAERVASRRPLRFMNVEIRNARQEGGGKQK